MKPLKKIFIAGGNGMVGSAIKRALLKEKHIEIIDKNHKDLDLSNQSQVRNFFSKNIIHEVYLAAAKVGGINANNQYPADFIYENLMIQSNVINESYNAGVKKLLFFGSSCIYPKYCSQPMSEESLLTGLLEPTNEPYAIAKIAGIKLCESFNRQFDTDFRTVMPTNLYGIKDNYHSLDSHVVPALIRRFHESKISNSAEIKVWGTGYAKREFLFVDDLASAALLIMSLSKSKYRSLTSDVSHLNVGFGSDITIKELAIEISKVVGFEGNIIFDTTKNDGTPKKLLDSSKISSLGWRPKINLKDGLIIAYNDFLEHKKNLRM